MLPISENSGLEFQLKKHKNSELIRKNSFNSLTFNSVFQPHPSRIWIILAILVLHVFLLCSLRFLLLPHRRYSYSSPLTAAVPPTTSVLGDEDACLSGRIFVYDLPKFFNEEILDNCDDLDPWISGCDVLSNHGFGREAKSLSGIVPKSVAPAWYWTDQFVLEVIFHNRILHHKCRVLEAESATAFYIPFYVGLAVAKYLWFNASANDRDHHCAEMLRWLQDQPYYKRSKGWDHFITMGRSSWDFRRSKDDNLNWGSSCINMPGMRNITRFLVEREPWDYFEIAVPFPTGFHPSSLSDVTDWQRFVRRKRRPNLFSFAGGARGAIKDDFRGLLFSHCRNMSGFCRVVDCGGSRCSNGTSAIMEAFLDSDFCLQPRGDSFTRKSVFDCMVAGSIPVFFWKKTAYYQYEWFLPPESTSYSVFIDRNGVKNGSISVKSLLEGFSEEEKKKMREKVIEFIPRFLYSKPEDGIENLKDAFDVAIEGVLRRFKEQDEPGYKWK